MELEKSIKVIQKRLDRLMEEFKIEKEDFTDEPRIAYLMQEIRASKTVIKYIKEESIPKAVVEEKIETLKQIRGEEIKTKFVLSYSTYNAITNEIDDLQEILNKGE